MGRGVAGGLPGRPHHLAGTRPRGLSEGRTGMDRPGFAGGGRPLGARGYRCANGAPDPVRPGLRSVIRFAWLDPATGAAVAVWRLLGGTARDPMNNPFASRTPADFWRRYNRPAQQFLYEDPFRP